jgi:tRNA U55 pseudouridine synthase TruB
MTGDIERLTLIQGQVIKLRRLAAEIFDREMSVMLYALADQIEQRTREADRRRCSPQDRL